ncbi:hypothetical protein Btru_002346 [Bulinus truncatus]|nr:hypothetical protein Btru_002346 [Bulinus truncatus]
MFNDMDVLDVEKELKKTAESLNADIVKQMDKCFHEITTTGNPSLTDGDKKKFKRFCRESDDYVRYAFLLIMRQLKKNHSEIRLSAFQMADELFNRSHAFREILVLHLQSFLGLTTGIEVKKPLPPPVAAANKLKRDSLLAIQCWYEKYGKGYRKLVHGYEYLKNCKLVDFTNLQAQSQAERLRIENEEKRKQKIMADNLDKVLQEISETHQEIVGCATEVENCLKLLLPTTSEDFLLDFTQLAEDKSSLDNGDSSFRHSDLKEQLSLDIAAHGPLSNDPLEYSSDIDHSSDDDDGGDDVDHHHDLSSHGYTNSKFSLSIEVPEKVCVQETVDNTDVMQSLKDASKLINSNYLPKVIKWLETLSKNGAMETDIKATIDLKVQLEAIRAKCVDLKLVTLELEKLNDDSDDEFEEVPEKEGFEPHIPNHLRAEYGLIGTSVKTEKPEKSPVTQDSYSKSSSHDKKSASWNLKERLTAQNTADPTSMANALSKMNSDSNIEKNPLNSEQNENKVSSQVPFVEFGADLACWENPDELEVPTIIKYDSLHRFWAPKDTESEKPSQQELSTVKNRAFIFPGKFEPVKWKCRAPLPNGKLCERMDRVKCPFHGRIVARNVDGKPSLTSELAITEESANGSDNPEPLTSHELPPWQDPELQREIEHATGHDLGSARSQKLLDKANKGKGKGKGKKSNLTDIKAINNTVHKRLGDKIFNKRSMKKVCAALDKSDYKRTRDKFGSHFQYSLH